MSDDNNELSPAQQKGVLEAKQVLADKEQALLMLGQVQALDFVSKLTTVGSLKILAQIKESKEFKGLTYFDSDGNCRTVGNWAEFCEHKLHKSRSTIDEKLLSLEVLGEEYFEAADRIGLGTKHMRKLRALPEDVRDEALEDDLLSTGTKEDIQNHIDDIVAQHTKENTDVKKQLGDANADNNALRQMNREAQENIEKLRTDLERQKFKPDDWPAELSDYLQQLSVCIEPLHQAISKANQCCDELYTFLQRAEVPKEAKEAIPRVIVGTLESAASASSLAYLQWRDHFGDVAPMAVYELMAQLANMHLPPEQQFPLEDD